MPQHQTQEEQPAADHKHVKELDCEVGVQDREDSNGDKRGSELLLSGEVRFVVCIIAAAE